MSNIYLKYKEGGYKNVDGWGIDEELIDIFKLINNFHVINKISGHLVEIGIHHGRTLILLGLLAKNGEQVFGIDLFDQQDQNLDLSGCGSYSQLIVNIAEHAPGIDFEIIRGNSFDLERSDIEKMRGARFFHIDGGHFLEVVLNDLSLAQDLINIGGVIVIDDYWHSGFPEVQEAVHKYFWGSGKLKAVPFAVGKNKIFLIGYSYREKIIEFILNNLDIVRKKHVRVLGYECLCLDPH